MPNSTASKPNETIQALRERLMRLANVEFPAAAKSGAYPVRFNHCFLRIVYDHVFGTQWQRILPKGQAAYKQLNAEQLTQAISIGESIIQDPALCSELNKASLAYRGKLR